MPKQIRYIELLIKIDSGRKAGAERIMSNKAKKSARMKPDLVQDHLSERNKATGKIAAELPESRSGLLAVGLAAVAACHAAVMAEDKVGLEAANARYEAVVWKLNGGTFFGCCDSANPDASGSVIKRYCSAKPGEIPMWGQAGEFLVAVAGVRCLVEFSTGFGSLMSAHFQFHAVDLAGPFISETGYLSHFEHPRSGLTVEQLACEIVSDRLKKHRRYIRAEEQTKLAAKPLRPWLAALPVPPRHASDVQDKPEEKYEVLPPGFVLVDVVLKEHQAFIVKKWAEAAKKKINIAKILQKKECLNAKEVAETGNVEPISEAACIKIELEESLNDMADKAYQHGAEEFKIGIKCVIMEVHHICFSRDIGKVIVVAKICHGSRQVWAYEDKPITYRINRRGQKVVYSDPKCIQSIYGMDSLRIL